MRSVIKRRRRRGAALVEAALVINVLFLLFFGVFEFGRLLMVRQVLDNAARGAARMAAAGTAAKSTSDITAEGLRLLRTGDFAAVPTVQVYKSNASGQNIGTWTDAAYGERIAVKITANYRPILPTFGIVPNNMSLSSLAVVRSEGD